MIEPIFRSEISKDLTGIDRVNDLAFDQNTESTLINQLRKSGKFLRDLSIVAIQDGKIVGHILFFPVNIEKAPLVKILSLAPMSVHPAYQNQGIGGKLIKKGLKSAAKRGFHAVVVLGHAFYYPKFGFRKASEWKLVTPWKGVPEEAFMALELKEGCLKGVQGTVVFPKEFDAAL